MNDLSPADRTLSQNQSLRVGSVWIEKFIVFYLEICDLSFADKTFSQNQILSVGVVWTGKCIRFHLGNA